MKERETDWKENYKSDNQKSSANPKHKKSWRKLHQGTSQSIYFKKT